MTASAVDVSTQPTSVWERVRDDVSIRRIGAALLIYFGGWLAAATWFENYRFDGPWIWLHIAAAVLFLAAIVMTFWPGVDGMPAATLTAIVTAVIFVLFVILPLFRSIDWHETPLIGGLFGDGRTIVELDEGFVSDRPECQSIMPGTYAARDPEVRFEFAATPPLSEDPEEMLSTLFTDILCEDEVNVAMQMTGMREEVQLEGQSTATQGNALANLLGSKGDGEHVVWRNALDTLWERWTTSELESIGDFSDMVEDGDANLLCQNQEYGSNDEGDIVPLGRPRIVQLDDVVLDDLRAQVGNDLHAFLINRGDAPGFEDGRVAFLTDIGCFAFDEETFGEDVDNLEHGLDGEEELVQPDDTAPTTGDTLPTPGDTVSDTDDQTGDTTGPGNENEDGTTGEPGDGGSCEGEPACEGEDPGGGGGGGEEDGDCPDCDGDGDGGGDKEEGDKCEKECPPDTTAPPTTSPPTTAPPTTKPTTTTSTTHPTTTTTTRPTTTTTTVPSTTTTTRPTTTSTTSTTTSSTTSTTEPTTSTTEPGKGEDPCENPFNPNCQDGNGADSAQAPVTVVMGMEIPISSENLGAFAQLVVALSTMMVLSIVASRSRNREAQALGRKE